MTARCSKCKSVNIRATDETWCICMGCGWSWQSVYATSTLRATWQEEIHAVGRGLMGLKVLLDPEVRAAVDDLMSLRAELA